MTDENIFETVHLYEQKLVNNLTKGKTVKVIGNSDIDDDLVLSDKTKVGEPNSPVFCFCQIYQ